MESANASKAEFLAAKEATGPEPVSLLTVLRGHRVDPYERWTSIRREHGDVARYRYALSDSYFISSAEGVKRVLLDNASNYTKEHASFAMLRRLFGDGLFTSEGSFWRRQRRLAQPAFHRQRIAAMSKLMAAAAVEAAERWEAEAAGARVSMVAEMAKITLKVVGDALFGAALSARAAVVAEAWDVLSTQLTERHSKMRLLPPILPTKYDRDFRRARRTMFGVVDEIIAQRRAQGRETDDLLSMFMHARDEDTGERMNDGQLRDEVVTMLLAGHETTAVALAWVWVLLDQHPSAAEKLHAELDRALAGRAPAAADVPDLPYTKGVIEEAMRLYPPAYIIPRHVREDDVVCGYRVHKGGSVVISPIVLHRHPVYWERPDDFLPERWADAEAEKRRPRFAYIPFGGGPRQCIGNGFALMEAVLVLATLAQRFRPRLAEGYAPKPEFHILSLPAGGAPMTLDRRAPRVGVESAARAGA
ncbi:cytochrome P450 [Sorangium sp. So ce363]|uniref:cytochrome P450 n=1 Tax=Sorangium sp. So ce363 TaxID=3133304 RepID=UPI003F5DBDD3